MLMPPIDETYHCEISGEYLTLVDGNGNHASVRYRIGNPAATKAVLDQLEVEFAFDRQAAERLLAEDRVIGVHALACRVLVVAVRRAEGWVAYCDAVPGQCHAEEAGDVKDHGDKLSKELAQTIFPMAAGPYIG